MAATNQLTIAITGDQTDLVKALQDATKQIDKFGKETEKTGKSTGTGFGTGFANGARGGLKLVTEGFRDVETAAVGGFSGIAQGFISKALNPMTLAIAGFGAALYGAFQFAKIGEENEKIGRTFTRFATDAGLNAELLKEKISGVAEGFVDLEDILPRAGEAILALGKNANQLPQILELARNIGVQTGRDVTQVFDELTKGIENQNVKLLRNNSIRLDGDKVLRDYAEANDLNVKSLSEAAKQQAFLNAALEQGNKKFGEAGAQAAPIQGGIKKLELAFDDLKDAIAGVVNSNLGAFFADVISGAASATKAVANFFTPEKTEAEMTLSEKVEATKNELVTLSNELSRARLDAPYLVENLNKQVQDANTKLMSLSAAQAAIEAQAAQAAALAPGEKTTGETPEQAAARIKQAEETAKRVAEIEAQTQLVNEQAKLDAQARANEASALDLTEYQARSDAKLQIDLARNQAAIDAEVMKNAATKQGAELAAANSLALAKKQAADEKAIGQQKFDAEKAAAAGRMKIEENLWATASILASDNAELTKALNIAQAVRNTYQGASLALATYPPPFGAIAAASTVALGLAQVAKITAANSGALVTGGTPGVDNQPFLLSKGEIVAPAKSFDEVVEGTARQRGFSKSGESTDELLRELISKMDSRAVAITVNTDVVADENGINKLVTRIRDAIDFNSAPSLG
jgi:hypothetical protein